MQWITPYLSCWLSFADLGVLPYLLWLSGEALTLAMAPTVTIPLSLCVAIWTLTYKTDKESTSSSRREIKGKGEMVPCCTILFFAVFLLIF